MDKIKLIIYVLLIKTLNDDLIYYNSYCYINALSFDILLWYQKHISF